MAKKRKAREVTVKSVNQLTQNMRRITFHGEDLASFPEDAEGAYFKLTFPGESLERPIMRTYTVARHRPAQNEIDVDFMLHSNADGSVSGVAARWAVDAQVGKDMSIFGPGPATFINTDADWYLLAGDMTALPAMVTNFGRLPEDAKGYVIIEIVSDDDRQDLPIPKGMDVIWVVNPQPGSDDSPLHVSVTEQKWLEGQVAVWAACEFKTMRKCRQYFRQERDVAKSHLYVSSYWKKGLSEEEHKIVKRDDAA